MYVMYFLNISKFILKLLLFKRIFFQILRHALTQPMNQIAKNAGLDSSVIVNKVVEANDVNTGYDALNGEFVNMLEAGIIDPTKVYIAGN